MAKTAANRAKAAAFWNDVRAGERSAPRRLRVPPAPEARTQDAYLRDMLEAAKLIQAYMAGIAFEDFWHNGEKRDAVALRLSVLGDSAQKIGKTTEAILPGVPFKGLRGMRNCLAHDYGAVDFKIVWAVTQQEVDPLITALETYFKERPHSAAV